MFYTRILKTFKKRIRGEEGQEKRTVEYIKLEREPVVDQAKFIVRSRGHFLLNGKI